MDVIGEQQRKRTAAAEADVIREQQLKWTQSESSSRGGRNWGTAAKAGAVGEHSSVQRAARRPGLLT